jgi:Ca-activated chloride channel family protein
MFVNVSTVAQNNNHTEKSRVGVDLVMILDKSGSMGGEKERLLRDAVEFVIAELDERDRLCTVAFDNRAHFEHGLINMGPAGRETALRHARGPGLRASGGTDIYDGLKTGVAALNARKVPNAVTTIFLLTDGIDNRHLEEKLALARQARSLGWFMFIFAFGADHNASHLNAIASAADSSYIFIDNIATVREAFGGAIGSQQGVAGKLLNLSVQAADEGVVIHRAAAGQYTSNVAADGRLAIVTYPNLLVGEKRDCCVEVTIPVAASGRDITTILNATLTYTPADASNDSVTTDDLTVISPPVTILRPATLDTPLPRHDAVDSQINRLNGIEAIEKATALADAGNLDAARALITRAKTEMETSVSVSHPSTQAMIAELTECMGRLQTRHEWESIGRSEQLESYNVHTCQRGVHSKKSRYTNNKSSASEQYSTTMSKACQSKASFF